MKKELSIREKEILGHLIDTEEPTLAMTMYGNIKEFDNKTTYDITVKNIIAHKMGVTPGCVHDKMIKVMLKCIRPNGKKVSYDTAKENLMKFCEEIMMEKV